MNTLTENDIIDQIYTLYEGDVDDWGTTSDEYLTARRLLNVGVNRWELYDNTVWKDLYTSLADASDGDKSVTASTYSYSCPTNFLRLVSFVKIGTSLYEVIPSENVIRYQTTKATSKWCYITGSRKDGFTLHINSKVTLTTDDTITYQYYKTATQFTTTDSTTEMNDPYFLVYFVLSRLYKGDGDAYQDTFAKAEARLEQMRTKNMGSLFNVTSDIRHNLDFIDGFGY